MRWIKAGLSWLVDQAIERWPAIITVVLAGGGMTWAASVSSWLNAYGPVGWGAAGVLTLLILSLAFFLFAAASSRMQMANYIKAKATASGTNVLAPVHHDERIEMAVFFHPFYRATENARFENCELFGPANIAADGCSFVEGGFIDCEIVIVRPDRPVKGAMLFRHCTFVRFRLYRVTLLMNADTYRNLPADMRAHVRVISDGRVGDL